MEATHGFAHRHRPGRHHGQFQPAEPRPVHQRRPGGAAGRQERGVRPGAAMALDPALPRRTVTWRRSRRSCCPGLQIGCIYALMALGFYIILSATGILNFAQGEWMMMSGVLGVTLLGFGAALPGRRWPASSAPPGSAVLAERLVIRPLQRRHAPQAITLLALFGIMLVARYGTGPASRTPGRAPARAPSARRIFLTRTSSSSADAADLRARPRRCSALMLFLRRTWLGRSLRIAAIDPLGGTLVGVNLDTVRLVAFAPAG